MSRRFAIDLPHKFLVRVGTLDAPNPASLVPEMELACDTERRTGSRTVVQAGTTSHVAPGLRAGLSLGDEVQGGPQPAGPATPHEPNAQPERGVRATRAAQPGTAGDPQLSGIPVLPTGCLGQPPVLTSNPGDFPLTRPTAVRS